MERPLNSGTVPSSKAAYDAAQLLIAQRNVRIGFTPTSKTSMVLETQQSGSVLNSKLRCVAHTTYDTFRQEYPILNAHVSTNTSGPNTPAYAQFGATAEYVIQKSDNVDLCRDLASNVINTLCSRSAYNCDRFYDEQYGITTTSLKESDDSPYLDADDALFTELDAVHAEGLKSNLEVNVVCAHRDWFECNIVRRYGISNMPVYIFDLPSLSYDKTANTVTLHSDIVERLVSTIDDVHNFPKVRTRTWRGLINKVKKVTNPLDYDWFTRDGYRPYDDWHVVEKFAREYETDSFYTYPETVRQSTSLVGPNGYICPTPDCMVTFPRLSLASNSVWSSLCLFAILTVAVFGFFKAFWRRLMAPVHRFVDHHFFFAFQANSGPRLRLGRYAYANAMRDRARATIFAEQNPGKNIPNPYNTNLVEPAPELLDPSDPGFYDEPPIWSWVYYPALHATVKSLYGIYELYCWIYSKISDVHKWLFRLYCVRNAYRYTKRAWTDVEHWKDAVTKFGAEVRTDLEYRRLLEIKSLFHIAYHAYKGNRFGVVEWATNFAITRPEWVAKLVELPFDLIKCSFDNPKAEILVNGKTVTVTSHTWGQLVGAYESDPLNPKYDDLIQDFEPNADSPMDAIFDMIAPSGGLTSSQIKDANAQFTFIRNNRTELGRKAEFGKLAISAIGRVVFGVDPFDPDYLSFVASMIGFVEYAAASKLRANDLLTDRMFMVEMISKAEASLRVYNNPKVNTAPRFLQNSYRNAHSEIEEMAYTATTQLKGNCSRIEPLSILLTGPPSVGKSTFTDFAMRAICRADKMSYNATMKFTRACGSQYWDGYNRQKFVVVDDLWKVKRSDARESQTAEIVDMINTSAVSLNMARIESKGNTYFDSEYVFFSTNACNTGLHNCDLKIGATDNDAIKRRFHLAFHRTEKLTGLIHETMWRVDTSPFPETVHSEANPIMFNAVEICQLIARVRAKQIADAKAHVYTDEQIDALFEPNADDVPSIQSIFTRIIGLQLYDWQHTQYYPYFIALFALIVTAAAATAYYNMFFSFQPNSAESEDFMDDPGMVFQNGKWVSWKKSAAYMDQKHADQQDDMYVSGHTSKKQQHRFSANLGGSNFEESIIKRISRGIMFAEAAAFDSFGKPVDTTTCIVSHVEDQWVVACSHWFSIYHDYAKKGITVKFAFTCAQGRYEMPFPAEKFIKQANANDTVFFKLAPNIPIMTRLLGDYCPAHATRKLAPGTALKIVKVTSSGVPVFRNVTTISGKPLIEYTSRNRPFAVQSPIAFFDNTVAGESGSLLIAEGPSGKPYIVGMHVGHQSNGLGTKTCYAAEFIHENITEFLEDDFVANMADRTLPVTVLRTVPTSRAHYPAKESRIKRSDVHGWAGRPVCVPAKLRPFKDRATGEFIDPISVALSKVNQLPFEGFTMPEHIFAIVHNMYKSYGTRSVLDYHDAINGDKMRGMPAIRMKTSSGYPFTLTCKLGGKHDLIERVGDILVCKNEFLKKLDEFGASLKAGICPEVLWADNMKDETRPIEKVKLGKTRVISSAPADFSVFVRMYFGHFIAHVQSTSSTKPVAVGINPHSMDWANLYNRMAKTNGSVVSCDFSNFDASIPAFMQDVFVEYVNRWYDDGEENAKIRRLLISACKNALHIIFEMIYQSEGGNPSGEGMTSVKNSIILYFSVLYIFVIVFKIPETDFNVAIYGDDTFITVAQKGMTWKHLVGPFKKYFGFTLTHCSKVDTDVHDTLETITFLSRKFVEERYAPLPITTIVEMTYWHRNKALKDEVLQSTADCFFTELSHYPIEVFNDYADRFLQHIHDNEEVSHLHDIITNKRKTWYHYNERKYSPRPGEAPLTLYYYKGEWAHPDVIDFIPEFEANMKPMLRTTMRPTDSTDQAPNENMEPVVTQEVQLGGFMDVNQVDHVGMAGGETQAATNSFNLESFTLDESLNRVYLLACPAWTTAMAFGTVIATYLFPDEIIVRNYILEKVSDFRYLKTDLIVTVRVKTTEFLYGTLIVDFTPNINDVSFASTNVYRSSGNHCATIAAETSETVAFEIPFVLYSRYLDLANYVTGDLGRVTIRVMNQLNDIQGNTLSADVVVTAQFVNAELFLPDDFEPAASAARGSYVNPAGPPIVHRNHQPSQLELDPSYLAAFNRFLHNERIIAEQLARDAEDMVDPTAFQANSGRSEARNKSRLGSIANNLISNSVVPSMVRVGSVVQTAAAVMSEIGRHSAGLSKPTTLATTDVMKVNPSSDFSYGKGIDTSLKLSMDPENSITTSSNVAGIAHDEMSMSAFVQMPMLLNILTINKGTAPQYVTQNGPETPPNGRWTYVDWMSQHFSGFSGSIKVGLDICASSFHAVTLMFFFTAVNPVTTSTWENCHQLSVEVHGRTWVEFTLPYTHGGLVSRRSASPINLWVFPIGWSEPYNSVDTPIYVNIYKSGAEDYKLYGHIERVFTVNFSPRDAFKSEFKMFVPGSKGYATSGYVYGEEITSIREMIHRPISSGPSAAQFSVWSGASVSGSTVGGLTMYGLPFFFWRGSIRFKLVVADSRYMDSVSISDGSFVYVGTYFSTPTNPVIEFTVPYYQTKMYQTTRDNSSIMINTGPQATRPKWVFRSAGDDFSFIFLRAPPDGVFAAAPTNGLLGFNTFMANANPRAVVVVT